jgi:hypothetical protein
VGEIGESSGGSPEVLDFVRRRRRRAPGPVGRGFESGESVLDAVVLPVEPAGVDPRESAVPSDRETDRREDDVARDVAALLVRAGQVGGRERVEGLVFLEERVEATPGLVDGGL